MENYKGKLLDKANNRLTESEHQTKQNLITKGQQEFAEILQKETKPVCCYCDNPEEHYHKICGCVGEGHLLTCSLYDSSVDKVNQTVKTDKEPFDLTQIPYTSLTRLGAVFLEGEKKYGKGNWLLGQDKEYYQLQRANHALKHLLVYIHYLNTGEYLGEKTSVNCLLYQGEDDLAKVMWFCATQMELERLEAKE